jgi:prepilin-type processing-associated H-X9-DG protein
MSRPIQWAVWVGVGLLLLSCVAPQIIMVMFELVVGWPMYLARVLPSVRFNLAGLATAAACLLMIVLLGHRFAGWMWSATSAGDGAAAERRPVWRMRWTMGVIAIVLLMFVAGIGATGVGHQTVWLARSERPMFEYRSRETANRVKCGSNLKQIGLALQLYAEKSGGRLPDSMIDLLLQEDLSPEVFCCPSSNDDRAPGATPAEQVRQIQRGRHCSYVYHGRGMTWPCGDTVPIACEPLANHAGDGMNILFGDGHVEFLTPTAAERAMRGLPATRPAQQVAGN